MNFFCDDFAREPETLSQARNIPAVFGRDVFILIMADQSEGYQTLANRRDNHLYAALDNRQQLRLLRWRHTLTYATQSR